MSSRPGPPQRKSGGQSQNKNQNQKRQQQGANSNQNRPTVASPSSVQQAPKTAPVDQQAKQAARLQRQTAAREAAQRRRRKQSVTRWAVVGAVVIVLGTLITTAMITEANKPGQLVSQQVSRPHVNPGDSHAAYITKPPTSGPHVGELPEWKIYNTAVLTDELQVHGLEDGAVFIDYKPDLDKATVDKLAAIATSYYEKPDPKNRVVLAPYKDLDHPIVLTAWRRIERLDAYDEAKIRRFTDEYAGVDHHKESDSTP